MATPEHATNAYSAQPLSSSSPAPGDDDTISDDSFDEASDHFAFTPKRPSKLPRAWERKPATPFAPRTETQKIWKRVPLQEKVINNPVEIRANGKDDGDARGVKRARLAGSAGGRGKENYANTQWATPTDDAKRKVPAMRKNVLQSTRNSLSPLSKDITSEILNGPPPPTALELEADLVINRLEEMQEADRARWRNSWSKVPRDSTTVETEKHQQAPSPPWSNDAEDEPTNEDEDLAPEDGETTKSTTNGFFTDSIICDDEDSESEVDETPDAETTVQDVKKSDSGSEIPYEFYLDQVLADLNEVLSPRRSISAVESADEQPLSVPDDYQPVTAVEPFVLNDLLPQDEEDNQASISEIEDSKLAQSIASPTRSPTEDTLPMIDGYETVLDLMDDIDDLQVPSEENAKPCESISESSESRVQDVIIPESNGQAETSRISETGLTDERIAPETSTIPQASTSGNTTIREDPQPDMLVFGEQKSDLSNQLFTPQAPILPAPEAPASDDTAYLHDFLTRARAQKAARAASSPEKVDNNTSSPSKNTRQALAKISNTTAPPLPAQPQLGTAENVEDFIEDDQATSPCRRSSRPRFPKPLKSIVPTVPNTIPVRRSNGTEFVFLQRTETMQIALDTRTNTKWNKGEAQPPSARLESLSSREMSPVREKKKSSKKRKTVRWSEKIVSEQIEAILEEQAVVAESSGSEMKSDQDQQEEVKKAEEDTKMMTATASSEEAAKSEKREKNARKSVKRLGTVNGTPAPKKKATVTALPVPTRTLRTRTAMGRP